MPVPRIMTPTESYVTYYPEFIELANTQMDCFWPWNEINVGKDKQDLMVGMTEAEKHGVTTVLKLFTKYELFVGNEYWLDRVMKAFPRPEVQRMAAAFGHVELNSHAPFYNEINRELGLATDEFYESYVNDPVLSSRMQFLNDLVDSDDHITSVGVFSIIEGAVLYTSFAYLKHFQSSGKNKILNVVRGINMSAIDENLHAQGGALLFKTAIREAGFSESEKQVIYSKIRQAAAMLYEHEARIIEMIFEKGQHEGITAHQLDNFAKSRIDICLMELGLEKMFNVSYNPIADTFYDGLNKVVFNDFFSGIGREYTRGWDKERFGWNVGEIDD